jgi:hypothetical protein
MSQIEALTSEEEALMPIVRDEWLKIGLATGSADRGAAQVAIADAYRMAGLEPPSLWIWLDSPFAGCWGAWMLWKAQLQDQLQNHMWAWMRNRVGGRVWDQLVDRVWNQVGDQAGNQIGELVGDEVWRRVWDQVVEQVQEQVAEPVWDHVRDQVQIRVWNQRDTQADEQVRYQVGEPVWFLVGQADHGQDDAGWLSFLDFFRRIGRVNGPNQLTPIMRAAAAASWWWPFAGACIIIERPVVHHRDEAGRLHNAQGPALAYPDDWAIHAWHGLLIPAWIVEDKGRITPDAIDAENNAEWRGVMLEIFGFDRYIAARGAKLIAEDECLGLPRQLFEIDLRGERVRVLRVVNGTVEADGRQRQFHLGVPLECNTPHEAVAWSYGRPPAIYRENIRS